MIWKGNYDDLTNFLHNINTTAIIKFDFVILKEMLSFYDAKVYIDKDWNVQTTAYSKETDRQSCLHSKCQN